MKQREFTWDMQRSESSNVGRLHRYIRSIAGTHKPCAKGKAKLRRNSRRILQRKAAWKR